MAQSKSKRKAVAAPKSGKRPERAESELQPAPPKDWRIVMGVDPGTRVTGYGLIVVAPSGPRLLAAGVLRVGDRGRISERLGRVRTGIDELLERFRPHTVALESAFTALNVRSALRIGEARGVVLSCAGRLGLEVDEYAPAEVKKAVTGNGAASKEQVAALVARTLAIEKLELALDATDALALALTHVYRARAAEITRSPSASQARPQKPKSARFGTARG